MMVLPTPLESVRRRPGMYLSEVTFDRMVAFMLGYDLALSGGFLIGFREWLAMRLGYGANLGWPGLVSEIMDRECSHSDTSRQSDQIEDLFGLIEHFLQERNKHDGLRKIYAAYEVWYAEQVQ